MTEEQKQYKLKQVERLLNMAMNEAICQPGRIQKPNSNNIAGFVSKFIKKNLVYILSEGDISMGNKKEEHGFKGMCCCNCKFQMKLMKHPMNISFGKGAMSEQCGYVCTVGFPEDGINDQAIYSDREHGMCEMHTKKEES